MVQTQQEVLSQIDEIEIEAPAITSKIIVDLSEKLDKVNKLHKQVSIELPELL